MFELIMQSKKLRFQHTRGLLVLDGHSDIIWKACAPGISELHPFWVVSMSKQTYRFWAPGCEKLPFYTPIYSNLLPWKYELVIRISRQNLESTINDFKQLW